MPESPPIADRLLDSFYPRSCLVSGEPLKGNRPYRYLCEEAGDRILHVGAPHCGICGHPFWGAADSEQACPHCVELQPAFREGKTAALMQGPARTLIHELKYRRGLYVIPDLVEMASRSPGFFEFLEGARLVPVPLHPRRRRRRGFNQSEELARAVLKRIGGGRMEPLLVRPRHTRTQTRLRRGERQANMLGAFRLRRGQLSDPDARYVLLDDVFTTGATLNACARVLKAAGAKKVDIVTFCHG